MMDEFEKIINKKGQGMCLGAIKFNKIGIKNITEDGFKKSTIS